MRPIGSLLSCFLTAETCIRELLTVPNATAIHEPLKPGSSPLACRQSKSFHQGTQDCRSSYHDQARLVALFKCTELCVTFAESWDLQRSDGSFTVHAVLRRR